MRLVTVLLFLLGCRTLDRASKRACDTTSDCVGLTTECINRVCLTFAERLASDPPNTGDPVPSGNTGVSDDETVPGCTKSSQCEAYDKVCVDALCSAAAVRDYAETQYALNVMLCDTAEEICGEQKITEIYGSLSACVFSSTPPWNLSLGPAVPPAINGWNAIKAAQCVADTRNMLLYGVARRAFAPLPEVCDDIGYSGFDSTCEHGQIECGLGRACSKPPTNAVDAWPCLSSYAGFGETCFNRNHSDFFKRFQDTCEDGLYCDMNGLGTCKHRIAKDGACELQKWGGDNDPVFDPCAAGYSCEDGTCKTFVARCPL